MAKPTAKHKQAHITEVSKEAITSNKMAEEKAILAELQNTTFFFMAQMLEKLDYYLEVI